MINMIVEQDILVAIISMQYQVSPSENPSCVSLLINVCIAIIILYQNCQLTVSQYEYFLR